MMFALTMAGGPVASGAASTSAATAWQIPQMSTLHHNWVKPGSISLSAVLEFPQDDASAAWDLGLPIDIARESPN